MADLSLAEGLAVLARRTKMARAMILIVMVLGSAMFVGEGLETIGIVDMAAPVPDAITTVFGLIYLAFGVAFFVSVVFVAMWIYRAHANLRAAGMETEFSPGWAVGWYFIPLANLFKPFQAMRELWNASHMVPTDYGSPASSDVRAWWGCFIVGNILSNASAQMTGWAGEHASSPGLTVGAVGTLFTVASAWFLLQIVRDVNVAQNSDLTAVGVFA